MPNGSSADQPAPQQSESGNPTPNRYGPWSWRGFTRNAVVITVLGGLLAWFIIEGVIPNLIPKNFGVVEDGRVYRSGELTTMALTSVVEDHGIKTIIDFGAHDHHPDDERREQKTADLLGVKRHVLNLEGDARGDPNRYVEALRLMRDESSGPVLVHCAAGAQRTGCAIALYRSLIEGWDDERALLEAENYRHDPADNPNMRKMFHTWKDEIARSLETGEPIEYDPARDDLPAEDDG